MYVALSGKVVIRMIDQPDELSLPERAEYMRSKEQIDRVHKEAINAARSAIETSVALRRFLDALEDLGD